MAKSKPITTARLREVTHYDPGTGAFTWRIATPGCRAGMVAGCRDKHGYVNIKIDGKNYRSHRLAWLYMTGEWPSGEIAHINGDKADNHIANLRPVNDSQNMWNRGANANNTSGFKGVWWHKRAQKWEAAIMANGNRFYVGLFPTPREAALAYDVASRTLHWPYGRQNLPAEDSSHVLLAGRALSRINHILFAAEAPEGGAIDAHRALLHLIPDL